MQQTHENSGWCLLPLMMWTAEIGQPLQRLESSRLAAAALCTPAALAQVACGRHQRCRASRLMLWPRGASAQMLPERTARRLLTPLLLLAWQEHVQQASPARAAHQRRQRLSRPYLLQSSSLVWRVGWSWAVDCWASATSADAQNLLLVPHPMFVPRV